MPRRTALDRRPTHLLLPALMLSLVAPAVASAADGDFALRLRSRIEAPGLPGQFALVERAEAWNPKRTAIIVCDMWDSHHCLNAVRRAKEMAPMMDRVLSSARARGAVIVHAPSGCTDAYKDHPARKHAIETPRSKHLPAEIGTWCYRIPAEEKGTYPIDQTDGGEDDDPAEHKQWAESLAAMGRNPRAPWKSQIDALTIDAADYVSDNGEEIWSVLEDRAVDHVILMGVHLNMCVLGRPFGLRQMARNGKSVVLLRDMTDTMYNPQRPPHVSHFAGTDLVVEHVEKYVCPTISSDQLLGGAPFRFKGDARPRVAFLIADDEYRTEVSLPAFAAAHLLKDFQISYILGNESDRNDLPGLADLAGSDAVVVSVRRRVLPKARLDALRGFVAAGKPVVGLRTASHAFAPRGGSAVPAGHDAWPGFDAEVLGGSYHGHHGAGPAVALSVAPGPVAGSHPILKGLDLAGVAGHGSLYKVSPLATTARALVVGSIPGQPSEPVAWVNAPASGNRVFYTSLGQIDDFKSPGFNRLLRNAIDWAVGRGPGGVTSP